MIASHEQARRAGTQIADSKSEHSIQALDAIRAFALVKVKDDFRVSMRCEFMSLALEFAAEFGEVVDFAVIGNPERAILVGHRHVAERGQIENGEAAAAQADI